MLSRGFNPVDESGSRNQLSFSPESLDMYGFLPQNQNPSHENQALELEDAFSRLSVSASAFSRSPFDDFPGVVDSSNVYPYSHGFHPHQTSNQTQESLIAFNNNNPLRNNNVVVSPYSEQTLWQNLLIARQRELLGSILNAPSSNESFGDTWSSISIPRGNNVSVNGRSPHWFDDFRGKVLSMAKDQHGSRDLQEVMKKSGTEGVSLIFLELIDHMTGLMFDPFGNYVVQKMVEICSEEQRTRIILNVTDHNFLFFRICLSPHGSRAVEKLLEHVTTREQITHIMSALCPGAIKLSKDINGHRVVLYCLKHFSHEDTQQFLHVVASNTCEVAKDKTGCCVLQHCVNYAQGDTRNRLIADIVRNASKLAEDCYGNYVVQHLLSLKIPSVTDRILSKLETQFVYLACNKYGSNVVEKFFQDSGELQSTRIILELLRSPQVAKLLVDPFGNYVIKSAVLVSKGFVRNALLQLIQNNSQMMRTNLYGKKLLDRFDRGRIRHT